VNTQTALKVALSIILYIFLQVFIVRNLVFFNVAFCFVYISAILTMPTSMRTSLYLILAFLIGLFVDAFYDTMGIHASASLLVAGIRNYVVKVLFPTKGLENEVVMSIDGMGAERFIRFIIILTFIHHLYLFFIEAGGFNFFLNTSLKVIASVMFSSVVIFLLQVYFKGLQNS
jgi:hypothetical protein